MSDNSARPVGAQPLQYARELPGPTRVSSAAVASLALALITSPWVLSPIMYGIEPFLRPFGFRLDPSLAFLGSAVASALAVAALLRIRLSRGTRTGKRLAIWGLVISLSWWALLLAIFLAWPKVH
jgi:hypothetical protein